VRCGKAPRVSRYGGNTPTTRTLDHAIYRCDTSTTKE
jgi:hypothetical protein